MAGKMDRRNFVKLVSASGLAAAVLPALGKNGFDLHAAADDKPVTNIASMAKYPRTERSMPGLFPGRVIESYSEKCVNNGKFSQEVISNMLEQSMLELTGEKDIAAAWLKFVSPKDKIGLKVNPIGGVQLSTSLELTRGIIAQLKAAGIPAENIIIWDRREFELYDAGFTAENFPGIKIAGTELKDSKGSFYDDNGKLYSEQMIDMEWYYEANVEQKYDAETLPYMINDGTKSYFSKIVTQMVDKIINVPILKNAGASVTLCLKNLAYGSISNTGRLHKKLWSETCAEVCAFPPLRDKVVLNIVDGIKGCFEGGPGVDPKYITEFKTLLVGSDPVSVDRVGYDIILNKRMAEKIQKEESPRGRKFMLLAADLKLGIEDISKIERKKIIID